MRKSTRVIHRHDRTWNLRMSTIISLGLGKPSRPMREIGGEESADISNGNESDWNRGPEPEWASLDALNQDVPALTFSDLVHP